jgi:hypothetical protein
MKTYDPHKSTEEVRGADRDTATRNVLVVAGIIVVIILALIWWWFAAHGGGNPLNNDY